MDPRRERHRVRHPLPSLSLQSSIGSIHSLRSNRSIHSPPPVLSDGDTPLSANSSVSITRSHSNLDLTSDFIFGHATNSSISTFESQGTFTTDRAARHSQESQRSLRSQSSHRSQSQSSHTSRKSHRSRSPAITPRDVGRREGNCERKTDEPAHRGRKDERGRWMKGKRAPTTPTVAGRQRKLEQSARSSASMSKVRDVFFDRQVLTPGYDYHHQKGVHSCS